MKKAPEGKGASIGSSHIMTSVYDVRPPKIDISRWVLRAEMLLLAHWGDIDAFKPPVHAGEFSLAEMMAEEFVPPTGEPAGDAWHEAQALTQDFWLIDQDSSEWKQRYWEIWDIWLALHPLRQRQLPIQRALS